ncbi:2-hydroxy-6-oxo-6-phenylhexa-2,4-dienoate hydrolase [Mycolicibacterium conceptionense]|uniref:2-hydroxy-6-oxo-6-phenylhexa-2,4-dienoate hydrolase n=1 Tax=Mycolicibacterium conceptionense TaxID=451644 RepID=A0A0U1DCG9_9MYCO|nr:2-hydroxy-6-oxo-6-phenylhexa-2,4-dienoate hydrolase [Mycolicibacterium conceptionense]
MTITELVEHTATIVGRPIFYVEAGAGPVVVMLHGGGPGASGVSNYGRNIDALAAHFRVIVPDMPGYGRSAKGVDKDDPFGFLADMIRGLLDELGVETAHLIGNSYGGAAALRLALDTPHRVGKLVLMGPGGIGTTRGLPTAGLNSLLRTTPVMVRAARNSRRSSAITSYTTVVLYPRILSNCGTEHPSIPKW